MVSHFAFWFKSKFDFRELSTFFLCCFQKLESSLKVQRPSKQNLICMLINLVCELPHELPHDLGLRVLGNQEILEQCQIRVETQVSALYPFQRLKFDNSSQKVRKSTCQIFLILSNFIGLLYFVPIGLRLSEQTNIWSEPGPVSSKLQFFDIFYSFKTFL